MEAIACGSIKIYLVKTLFFCSLDEAQAFVVCSGFARGRSPLAIKLRNMAVGIGSH